MLIKIGLGEMGTDTMMFYDGRNAYKKAFWTFILYIYMDLKIIEWIY